MGTRILLFTGKGGVGKTTLSAATAARSARMGRRTLLLSADPAHSIGDVLDVEVGMDPTQVAPGFFAQEIEVARELERHWGAVAEFLGRFFRAQGLDPLRAGELAVLPGMDEAVALLSLEQAVRTGDWDVVVLDCAPTGATARLLALPEASRWYMERVFPLERRLVAGAAPLLERAAGVPIPRGPVFDAIAALHARLDAAGRLLADPARTRVRLVTNPERMAVRETQRAWVSLDLFGFPADGVLVNKILPAGARRGFHEGWGDAQETQLRAIDEAFWFLSVKKVALQAREVAGHAALAALGKRIYGDADPAERLGDPRVTIAPAAGEDVARRSPGNRSAPERAPVGAGYELSLDLPPALARGRGVLDVSSDGESLWIARGRVRRSVPLPRALAALEPQAGRIGRERLVVRFAPVQRGVA